MKHPSQMTVAEGELEVAKEIVERLVDVLSRADPAYCAQHGVEQVTDEEWDEELAEADEWLSEQQERAT